MLLICNCLSPGIARLKSRARQAFTILEAAVASAIVTFILTGLLMLQSNMMHMLASSTETTNASAHLQTRVEQIRLANWTQLSDPGWIQSNLLQSPTEADATLPGLTETCTVTPYQSPCSGKPAVTPPAPFTVTRNANGTLTCNPAGYASVVLLSQQEMLQIDLSVTWPSLGRTRTRAQSLLISPWGISK